MDMMKASMSVIAGQLQAGDIVSMVTWSSDDRLILDSHTITGPSDTALKGAITDLSAAGGTDLSNGLTKGYALAEKNYSVGRINRVVLISDGGANMGVTDGALIGAHAADSDAEGIYLVGVGVGTHNYDDTLMDDVTDLGKGAAVFIPTEAEAERVFSERFSNTFGVSARDVGLQLTLPPGFEIVRFSGEEYSTDFTEIEPQHLAPDDSMVFFQEIETCAPEGISDESPVTVTAVWKDPLTFVSNEQVLSTTFGELAAADTVELTRGAALFAYVEMLKACRYGCSDAVGLAAWDTSMDALDAADLLLPGDADLAELRLITEALAP